MATAVPRQDLPPTGGFAPIRYKRNLPKRGPPGFFYFLGGSLAIIFGLYKVGDGNHKNWLLKQERAEARQALVPLLSAEEDRRFLKWKESADREEAELMKHVRGYHVGEKLYHSDRWVAPAQVSER